MEGKILVVNYWICFRKFHCCCNCAKRTDNATASARAHSSEERTHGSCFRRPDDGPDGYTGAGASDFRKSFFSGIQYFKGLVHLVKFYHVKISLIFSENNYLFARYPRILYMDLKMFSLQISYKIIYFSNNGNYFKICNFVLFNTYLS